MTKSIKELATVLSVIGLDLADVNSDWAGLDQDGKVVRRERVRTTEGELRRVFGALAATTVIMEVGTHSAWTSQVLKSLGHEVIVANARRVALIHRNKRKNNRIDAEFLARLGRADKELLFPIHHRTVEARADLAVLRTRDVLTRSRGSLINHVRGICKSFGVRIPKCSADAFVTRASALVPKELSGATNIVLDQIAGLTAKIKALNKTVTSMMDSHPEAKIVSQIPGVGELTALAYVLTIEDPRRIRRSRSAGAYLGLVPGSDDSGEKRQQRRITKEGDPFCRRLLVCAAQYILGPFGKDSDLRRHGEAIAQRGGKNAKKRAVVAVARKLAVVMHHLWRHNGTYVPLFNSLKTEIAA
jgi:transposase